MGSQEGNIAHTYSPGLLGTDAENMSGADKCTFKAEIKIINPNFDQNYGIQQLIVKKDTQNGKEIGPAQTGDKNPTGWVVSPAKSGSAYGFGPQLGGFVFGASSEGADTVSQIIAVNPGSAYKVSYYYKPSGNPTFLQVSADTVALVIIKDGSGTSYNPGYFIATSKSVTVSFSGSTPNGFSVLKAISVQECV